MIVWHVLLVIIALPDLLLLHALLENTVQKDL